MNIVSKLNVLSSDFIPQYLLSYGIKDINKFINPTKDCFEPWEHYNNIQDAIIKFDFHIRYKKKIGIVMDSDQDGACSAALIYNFIKYIKATNEIKIYYHKGKQHGLKDLLSEILEDNLSLLIIPDAGSNDINECMEISSKGTEIIILDHHIIEKNNPYACIVNNQIQGVENKELSGTGVTDKFVRGYCSKHDITYPNYTDLVAVSLVSDICDLSVLENRAYMYYGLNNITNPFLNFLFNKLCEKRGFNSDGIGWEISPLANALARSEEQSTKRLFFDGLIGNLLPEDCLKEMRKIKRQQDNEVKKIVNEIEPNLNLDEKVIIDFTDAANASFLGLIANKFTGKYRKPTFLLRESNSTTWSGSFRSPVPLLSKINSSGIAKAQGHEGAAGVFIQKSKFERFKKWLNDLDLSEKPDIEVTACIEPQEITIDLCKKIIENKSLFGHGLPSPTFYIKTKVNQSNVFVFNKSTVTLKLDINGLGCLKFFASETDVKNFTEYDNFEIELVIGDLGINEYNGFVSPQCNIIDYEIHPINFKNENEKWEDLF